MSSYIVILMIGSNMLGMVMSEKEYTNGQHCQAAETVRWTNIRKPDDPKIEVLNCVKGARFLADIKEDGELWYKLVDKLEESQ